MKKFSQLMFIGTVLAAFVGLEVLAAKLGGTIFYWVGIALFIACTRRLRDARNAITPRPKGGDEGQERSP